MMKRRDLLLTAPALLAAKPFALPIGINLFTVRGPLATKPAETYKALASIGLKTLEVRPVHLMQHSSMISDAGLKPVHMFIESATVTGAWAEWKTYSAGMAARFKMPVPPANAPQARLEDMIDLAKKHGLQRIGTSMLLPGERSGAIASINRASEKCAAAGLELYYHNHAYEFDGKPGERYLDLLRKELDPRVRLELDVFWAAIKGNDAADVLKAWKGRVKSVHLKDIAPDAKPAASETEVPPSAFREIGKGRLDFKSILKAAKKAGVEHYLIELDHSPGDPLVSVKNCFDYLRRVEL